MKVFSTISSVIALIHFTPSPIHSFVILPQSINKQLIRKTSTNQSERFLFGGFFDDDSTIPKEYRAEIYAAEAKTPAAQGRESRTLAYSSIAILFFILGVSNVILTTMKENGVDLEIEGYGWTSYIPFLSTSWGGFVDILAAGLLGTFVELENRTKEDVAEQIWEEFQKRKSDSRKPKRKMKKVRPVSSKKEKAKISKREKRFAAIAEVAMEDEAQMDKLPESSAAATTEEIIKDSPKEEGMWNKVKSFYNEADQMAASQALLLNKALEDKGVVDKITDETGLKVIGKEAAAEDKRKADQKEVVDDAK